MRLNALFKLINKGNKSYCIIRLGIIIKFYYPILNKKHNK